MGADVIVTGDVLRFVEEYRLNLKIHDCRSAAFLGSETAGGDNLYTLEKAISPVTGKLSGTIRRHYGSGGRLGPGFREGGGGERVDGDWNPALDQMALVSFDSDPAYFDVWEDV